MEILKIKTEKALLGRYGEKMARRYLRRHGYKIVKKNFLAETNEIDIIAENKDTLAFVEVKTRTIGHENPNEPRPASSVTPEKQRKIITTAKYFLGTHFPKKRVRFDVVEVFVDESKRVIKISHLEAAFNYNTAHPQGWFRI